MRRGAKTTNCQKCIDMAYVTKSTGRRGGGGGSGAARRGRDQLARYLRASQTWRCVPLLFTMLDTEILINAVHERPILWDKRNKLYHSRLISQNEWEELAKDIGTTSEKAKKKWKNLKDTFIKEFKKISTSTDSDAMFEYTGTWPHFEALSFLIDIIKPRKPEGNSLPENNLKNLDDNVVIKIEETDSNQESMNLLKELTHTYNTLQVPSPLPSTSGLSRKRKDNGFEELDTDKQKIKKLLEESRDKTDKDNADDDVLWYKSLMPYIKQLTPMKKLNFRTQAQDLLHKELSKSSLFDDFTFLKHSD
ncbi:uncharacterized protein LOC118268518 [Spodoptera frugiperda]|uniref:Uncharacterized protein LOC118268518 n=1 Tax=Spodoptera frugiperda TaxID=7108 RepID=A0A9R0EJY8_SPOFR|nr:uncharacterized protein LOC118268518 [Spodoptera frugiperda]XP_050560502.1 uncharacterized protein LOC118268518 [Spodoptera frugiperda]